MIVFSFYFSFLFGVDNFGIKVTETLWEFTRYRDYSNYITCIGLYELMRQSGAVRLSFGQFPQGIPKSK